MKKLFILLISLIFITSCNKEDKLSEIEVKEYIAQGKEIGQTTVKALGKNLMASMKKGGPKEAIPFCNAEASPIVKEMEEKFNVTIKRTSHKIRNEKSAPSTTEEKIITEYQTMMTKGEKLKPIVSKDDAGKVHFYAPIKLEGKCIVCHGTVGKEVSEETNRLIKSFYPNDTATGFKVGDLRGIVNITFEK